MKTDAWSGEFPALAKAGQPGAGGAGGAVRSKSRSVIIDFREAHRINKVLTTLANRPDRAFGAVAPPCEGGEYVPHTFQNEFTAVWAATVIPMQ